MLNWFPFPRSGATVRIATALTIALFGLAILTPVLDAAPRNPVSTLKGSWKGGGSFKLADGTSERISCNAYYTGGGTQLGLAILCSSSANKIHMRGKVSFSGSRVSGTWEERTYNAEGRLSGKSTSGKLSMSISGNVRGSMNVTYGARKQNVHISTVGSNLTTVDITLRR